MLELWLAWRYLLGKNAPALKLVSGLAVLGLALGVATLVVVMSVVSGFEQALKEAVTDVTAHVLLLKRGEPLENMSVLAPKIRKVVPSVTSMLPFVYVEGLAAHKGHIAGIALQGFDEKEWEKAIRLDHRLVAGRLDIHAVKPPYPVLVGRALAQKLEVHVGDELSVVVPKSSAETTRGLGFQSRVRSFRVSGVVDLGMYDFDSRFLIASSRAAQDLAGIGPVYTGLRLRLKNPDDARQASFNLAAVLGIMWWSRDWQESFHNLFEAIKLEKIVIFVVILFMTIAACFNIASSLFVSVLWRFGAISVLKALGTRGLRLVMVFCLQGLLLGVIGTALGMILGLGVGQLIAHNHLIYVPADVYHLNHLPVRVTVHDLLLIAACSLGLCLLSTLGPSIRASRLDPVEGLRYD